MGHAMIGAIKFHLTDVTRPVRSATPGYAGSMIPKLDDVRRDHVHLSPQRCIRGPSSPIRVNTCEQESVRDDHLRIGLILALMVPAGLASFALLTKDWRVLAAICLGIGAGLAALACSVLLWNWLNEKDWRITSKAFASNHLAPSPACGATLGFTVAPRSSEYALQRE